MKKEHWLVIVVLALAVVGYYSMFVAEVPLLGAVLVKPGAVVPQTGNGANSFFEMLQEAGPFGKCEPVTGPCGGCTHCAHTCSILCVDDITNCCKGQPLDLEICVPNECLFGANGRDDSNAVISDDWSCCNGQCFNPRGKDNVMFNADDEACCGPAGTYKPAVKQCCVSDDVTPQNYELLSFKECCKLQIVCEDGNFGMQTSCRNAQEPCGLAMAPEFADCLGLVCGNWYSKDYLASLQTPNPLPYACSESSFMNSFLRCVIKHELSHSRNCDSPPPNCRDEINAFAESLACTQALPCNSPEECDFKQMNIALDNQYTNMASCVCTFIESSGSIEGPDCQTCLNDNGLFNKDVCQQYCRKNRIGESPPDYCGTFPSPRSADDLLRDLFLS